jgi:protoporphyrin/coproporphyrin ferrochelatase
MPAAAGTGVVLVNLGTPSAPTTGAVRRYLREFLSDPRVVDLPRLVWLPLLYGLVLTTRPSKSAEKYAKIWTHEGSPLAVHTARQAKLLAGLLGERARPGPPVPVAYAMRYGDPSIASAFEKLEKAACGRIVVVPLYPQYSVSTTASVRDALKKYVKTVAKRPEIRFVERFHDDPGYIDALARVVMKRWEQTGSARTHGGKLIFSFHGIPKRSVDRGDPYESECRQTAALLAKRIGLNEGEWLVTFQSRFGRSEWLKPYTEPTLIELARGGLKRADVFCPGFPADCLETLEELGIGAREAFLKAGGKEFNLVPCLNEDPAWIEALANIALPAKDLRPNP